jgi:hypothetical protein
VEKFVAGLAAFGSTDARPKRVERNIQVMLHPLSREQRGKSPAKGDTTAGPAIAPVPPPTPPHGVAAAPRLSE